MGYMCFYEKGVISTLDGGSLKSVDKFMYCACSVTSTVNYINILLVKAYRLLSIFINHMKV